MVRESLALPGLVIGNRLETLANAVRFTTPELAALASRIANAAAQVLELELALFAELVSETLAASDVIARAAQALGEADVMLGLGELASEQRYRRPRVDQSLAFMIKGANDWSIDRMIRK